MLQIVQILKTLGRHIRTTLIAGLLIIFPVVVTAVILRVAFNFLDGLLEEPLEQFIPGRYILGTGIVTLVVVIYLAGLVTTHFLGRRIIKLGHSMADRVPIVSGVYRAARQATDVFSAVSAKSNGRYSSVVLVEFPGYGLRSLGLVTGSMNDKDGNTLLVVYMPTSPFPTSGFFVILREDQITHTDMPVDEAIKLIVSAGVVAPDRIITNPSTYVGAPYAPPWSSALGSEGQPGQDQAPGNRTSNQ